MTTALALPNDGDSLRESLVNADLLSLAFDRTRFKGSLREFLKAAWPVVEPTQPLVMTWHLEVLCDVLQRITIDRDQPRRWIINIPPGTLKSLLVSVIWPAWVWARTPEKRFFAASYGQTLSNRDNVRLRNIIQSPWYQALFPLTLVDDQNTKTRYNNHRGGWRIASSVGGPGTGEHPDYIIIDDPTTAQQAASEPERAAANMWFDQTVSSRGLTRHVVIVVVMQRLHQEDLTGHLQALGGWETIRFPMRHEANAADPRDLRTVDGELLCPSLIADDKVRRLELDLGPYGAASQLQQRPVPEGGGLFKRSWFGTIAAVPAGVRWIRAYDTAGTEGGGDYTAGVKLGLMADGRFLVGGVVRGQWSPANVDRNIITTANLDGIGCSIREEQEGGSAGKSVTSARARALTRFDYRGVPISGDKMTRIKPFRSQTEAGNVLLLVTGDPSRDAWVEPYLQELCAFPTGKHDDQVDATGCGYNALVEDKSALKPWDDPKINALAGKCTW